MTTNPITAAFPTICSVLSNSGLHEDVEFALELAAGESSEEDLRNALEEEFFNLNELMWRLLGATLLPGKDPEASELEANLATVVSEVGLDEAQGAYRDKLLVNDKNQFVDARYEIAVTARICGVLDAGSVRLEFPISGTRNNSDIYGTFGGSPVRIEVTVLHESLPPTVHLELDEYARGAEINSGFRVNLRRVLATQQHAGRVRALIEFLHEKHATSGGADLKIDGILFEWRKGAYHCERRESPIKSIQFDLPADYRDIIHPVSTQSVTPQFIIEDFEQPESVVTWADIPHDPEHHKEIPVSTKVRQMLDSKRRQCEEGIANVVAFCNPLSMHDREVANAVYGVSMVIVPYDEDESKLRHFKEHIIGRNHKVPFVPDRLMEVEDRVQFVDPFRKMSAIWLFRLGTDARSRILPNFNASHPVPDELHDALSDREKSSQ